MPVAAIVLGSGLAVATTNKLNPHNVYKDPVSGAWENLSEFSGNYSCEDEGQCTGYRDSTNHIIDIRNGVFTPEE